MEIIIILLLSTCLVLSLFISIKLYVSNKSLSNDNIKLKKELNTSESIFSMESGDKALIPDYPLMSKNSDEKFKVTYEVEIIEVSLKKVKVNSINFYSESDFAKDPSNKQGILNFMKKRWIEKKRIELMIDDSMKRDMKLKQLGI